ncbi:MAG: TolC family protein [Bacteroidales bacterium]
MMKINICIFLLIISFTAIQAQQKLSSDEAISIALKNNYDILVAKNSSEAARINNTAGNAGMLPNIAITASDNYSLNNVDQKYSAGTETKTPDAHSNSLNSGAELNWTLFDGGKMFVTKNKLDQIQTLGEIQFKDQVLQTVSDVIVAYYNVVRQTQQLVSIEEAINSIQVMVNILQTSFSAGLSPKTNLLQAQIDLNEYRENAINQQAVIIASKRSLNQLLSRDPNIVFEVADSIPLGYIPDKNELSQKLYTSNTSVLSFQKQMEIARLSLKEFKTNLLPKVSVNAGYNFFKSNNNYSTVLMNQTFGPQVGGTISIPLYQSGNESRQIETAKLQLQSAEYNLENTKLMVNSELQNTLTNYDNQLQLLEIEKSNMELAKENLSITMERLRLGQTTSLELHQAQQSYVDSQTRFINFEYNLKVAETKLKQLLAILQ